MMKFIPNVVSSAVGRGILQSQKASPTVLFAAGIVGMAATTVLACRATLKVDELLEDTQKDLMRVEEFITHPVDGASYEFKDYRKDKAVIYLRTAGRLTRLYSPAIVCGVISVGALAGSHNILSKRNASLVAAYSTVEKAFKEYRGRVQEELGEDREREIYHNLEACEIDDPDKPGKTKKAMKPTNGSASMYARFFSRETSKEFMQTPEYNLIFLKAQQAYANNLLQSRGHVLLNDVFDGLGLERTKAGAVVGWVRSGHGDGYISFGCLEGENQDRFLDFMVGAEDELLLDFNVDGVIYDQI